LSIAESLVGDAANGSGFSLVISGSKVSVALNIKLSTLSGSRKSSTVPFFQYRYFSLCFFFSSPS